MATRHKVPVEDYLALPDWEKPYLEYLEGEVVPKVAADFRHGSLAGALGHYLFRYQLELGGHSGPEIRMELRTPEGGIYFLLPDVSYWSPDRVPLGDRAANPPTLAVEVRSPGQTMASQRERARLYVANGVDVCWVIDPEHRTVEVFERESEPRALDESAILVCDALPGFELPVAELFAVLDR